MIHKIAEKMINWQIVKGNLTETDRNKYVYAYEILFNQLVNLSIAVVLAFVSHELISVLLFLVIYIPLRKYAGGFHAENNEKCIIYSSLVIICVIIFNTTLHDVTNAYEGIISIMMICFMLMLAFIWHMTPIEAKNKKLDELERRRCRRKVHIICIIHILFMIWNVLILMRICISINILLAYATVVLVLAIGYKKR